MAWSLVSKMKRSAVFLLTFLLLPLSPGWVPSSLAAKETRRVLVLFSQEKGHPAHDLTEQGIRHAFRSSPVFDVELFIEYLDVARFSDPSKASGVANFLLQKYAGRKIDATIAVYPAAVDFLRGDGPRRPLVDPVHAPRRHEVRRGDWDPGDGEQRRRPRRFCGGSGGVCHPDVRRAPVPVLLNGCDKETHTGIAVNIRDGTDGGDSLVIAPNLHLIVQWPQQKGKP
jgi:hypothetical protein